MTQSVDSTKAVKRLQRELKKLKKQKLPYADAGPLKDDMLLWLATISGPKDSPYSGGKFKVEIHFSPQYPMKAPQLKFQTKIYHPSVLQKDGTVCEEILGKNWAPVLNIFYILETIQQMMADPSSDSPLEQEVAKQLTENKKKFLETAKKWTKKHAK